MKVSKNRDEVRVLKLNIKTEIFPEDMLDYPNLEELYLEGNCKTFPQNAPFWNSLRVLSIKWPNFDGDLSSIFKLPKLENLKIIETPLKSFILPLGHAPAPVKSLTIKDCSLLALPEEISMLPLLNEMNLSGNELIRLPVSFVELKNLKRLNLDKNHFEAFPDFIKKMSKLTHLSIDGNKFPEEEKERIQREFHIWPN
jgi:Leucine-rich repeat (LRR) protein